ncbi:hypothetical protein MCUN1_000017 [Malassezia cuniculi]|uniref:Rab-GAP TBC domain-containing protein n=1 Tax=Malassezia cuniculi TaxID=948313 RepID=A0AAF0EQW0_9BASI|nr:hypothetical protein MCUN1_000017 [Malassezia cuniculi]
MTHSNGDAGDTQFVDVVLNEQSVAQPTEPVPERSGSLSSYRRNASRWQSHVALNNLGSLTPSENSRRSSTPALASTILSDGAESSDEAMSQSQVISRRVEGRYRRRNIKSYTLDNASTPNLRRKQDVALEPTLSPGMTLTVVDDNGELVVVRSPEMNGTPTAPKFKSQVDKAAANLSIGSLSATQSPDNSLIMDTSIKSEPNGDGTPINTNRTRMPHLPPKSAEEEARHLEAFTAMMREAKLIEKRKEEERKRKRAERLERRVQMRHVWDQEILPCWTRARTEQQYRELWQDGIPGVLRSRLWPRACGNSLLLPHSLFARALESANKMREDHTFPQSVQNAIDSDIEHTLPSLKLFQKDIGALWEDLSNVLAAFAVIRLDEASKRSNIDIEHADEIARRYHIYVPGTASIAAMLVMNVSPSAALLSIFNLIAARGWLHTLYALEEDDIQTRQLLAYERVFNTLLAEKLPMVYANMQRMGVHASTYLREWIRTLFVPLLDLDTVSRLWDNILLDEGDAPLYRIALALVQLLEARLYVKDKAELESILHGTNAGSLSVWRRESDIDQAVPLDCIYAQYAIDEDAVFDMFHEQDSWWKDSTLRRLLDRELVD